MPLTVVIMVLELCKRAITINADLRSVCKARCWCSFMILLQVRSAIWHSCCNTREFTIFSVSCRGAVHVHSDLCFVPCMQFLPERKLGADDGNNMINYVVLMIHIIRMARKYYNL